MTRVWLAAAAVAVAAWALMGRPPSLDSLARQSLARIHGAATVPHLRQSAQVVRDEWGVPHITARSEEDLFFAQGYVVAQDRLWQMEIWRRTATGRLAEIVGPQAVPRDRIARLLKYRGPPDDEELTTYHPRARRLMTAFVNGVNSFITQHAARLPVEFVLTGIVPEPWTIDDLTLRQTTFGDAASELILARSVAHAGLSETNRLANPDPFDELILPDGIDPAAIGPEVIEAARVPGRLRPPQLLPAYQDHARPGAPSGDVADPGSNNWVVSGKLSATGKPVVVNDPHREVTLPSLRYIVHLTAPGWNVIGATEPPFLSIAAGHNDRLAWGLTIVGTDQHDVYVEELNPADPNQVRDGDGWTPMRIVREEIKVKGAPAHTVELKYTRHGPVFHEDRGRLRAYALKSALHAPGTAPYLAGLRLSQAENCRAFLDAAAYWHAPSENLICGDVDGNIAWRASALTPDRSAPSGGKRRRWNGRLPVPGTGAYEWRGFRRDLPSQFNPPSGLIATANNNVQPPGYAPPFMYKNADTRYDRITRLNQLLVPGRTYTLEDHQRLQNDAFSLRAADDRRIFTGWASKDAEVERARALLAGWDAIYRRDSVEAAIYETWRDLARSSIRPGDVEASLRVAINRLIGAQGADWRHWRWGRMHARAFPHPLTRAFDLPPVERDGGAGTVAADGATYREIMDVADWDRSLATNTPGQSGQPGSPFYGNLLPLWAENRYFPLAFSRQAVESHAKYRLTLEPATAK